MVNPLPAKGAALLHQLIRRLPTLRFTLVEGWWDTASEFTSYPNVHCVPRTSAMGPIYTANDLLLVPSQVKDAFPRVIAPRRPHDRLVPRRHFRGGERRRNHPPPRRRGRLGAGDRDG